MIAVPETGGNIRRHRCHGVALHHRSTAPPLLLLLLPGLVASCCHHHPSPLYPLHMSISPPSLPLFSLSFSFHCSAATTSRRWWACSSLLTLAAESTGRRDIGNKYLKGGGTQLSQMCRNRHSNPPSEANVSKARGLLFVFSSEAL